MPDSMASRKQLVEVCSEHLAERTQEECIRHAGYVVQDVDWSFFLSYATQAQVKVKELVEHGYVGRRDRPSWAAGFWVQGPKIIGVFLPFRSALYTVRKPSGWYG